jgi:hypothetical protein
MVASVSFHREAGLLNSVYFNDIRAQDFGGQWENDKFYVGLVGRSERIDQNEWRFFDIVMVSPNFSDELTDFGIQAQADLRQTARIGSTTSTTIPDAHVITTGVLDKAILSNSLDGASLPFDRRFG